MSKKKVIGNELLKWWQYVCHVNRLKNVNLKSMSL